MRLQELADLIPIVEIQGSLAVEITGVSMHSQQVRPGDLFVCIPGIPGLQEDRHPFARAAAQAGAAAVVAERQVDADGIPVVIVPDARYALAVMAAHLYGHPSRRLKLIGVTGTNGKTTASHMIEAVLAYAGFRTGLMGNIGTKIGDVLYETRINTQDPPQLQANLKRMVVAGVDIAVMEVSSQGLHMGRVIGCEFRTAVFTNLTQDHLDYHGTMEAYLAAKGLLFAQLGNGSSRGDSERKFAVLNADDPASAKLAAMTSVQAVTYGISNEADVRAANVRLTGQGTFFDLVTEAGTTAVHLKTVGLFNVSNALTAAAVALTEGIPLSVIRDGLEEFAGVPGRMEIIDKGQPFLVLADYAHTPDGLEKALSALREFAEGRIITVFGCGGDRDRAKRPLMGETASKYSDIVIVTSDNPRSEDPARIMGDIAEGFARTEFAPYELIENREAAIARAIGLAAAGDVVLIAGKGHETYQILRNGTIPFDDRAVAGAAIVAQIH